MQPERLDDSDLQKKKTLLQKEIIDKQLNKEQFIDFCSSKKSYGDDLSRWEYSELKVVVDEFVKYHEDEIRQNEERQKRIMENQQKEQEIKIDIEKLKSDQMEMSTPTRYTKEIQCKRLELSVLNNKAVTVTVTNPKGIETGMFQTNFITYEVITDVTGWNVRRRYSDFEWLRNVLTKFYPRLSVPPLPSKKIGSRRFEPDFVEKRMTFLQKFMSNIIESEVFKASEAVYSFLYSNDRSQFESKMKELSSFLPSPYIEDIKTLTGKLKLLEDDGNDQYYKNISNYFRLQSQLFDRLNYNLKNFYFNTTAACQNLEEVQKDFETLSMLNSRVIMNSAITGTYDEMAMFFKNWKRILFNENETIKTHVKDFFKYIQMEGATYEELIKSRDDLKAKYMLEHTKLCSKKDKLWANMDVSKWEIIDDLDRVDRLLLVRDRSYATAKMCTRETQIVDNLRKQLDYANCMNNEELKRSINQNNIKYFANMKKFVEALYPSLNDGLNVWSALASNLDMGNVIKSS